MDVGGVPYLMPTPMKVWCFNKIVNQKQERSAAPLSYNKEYFIMSGAAYVVFLIVMYHV